MCQLLRILISMCRAFPSQIKSVAIFYHNKVGAVFHRLFFRIFLLICFVARENSGLPLPTKPKAPKLGGKQIMDCPTIMPARSAIYHFI